MIDATSITALQTCKRKYYYTMLQHYVPKEESVHLTFGRLFASGVESFYRGTSLREVVRQALTSPFHNGTLQKNRQTLIQALVDYLDTYAAQDQEKIYQTANGPALEISFALPLSDKVTLCGKFDRVVYGDGGFFIMDQKTTSSLGPKYFTLFTPNNQISAYLLAGKSIFPKPVSGFILDAVCVNPKKTTFSRGIISRTESQLDEWVKGVLWEIDSIANLDPEEESDWPQNPTACGYYTGCAFREVCSASPCSRHLYLKEQFRKEKWNPATGERVNET